MDEMWGRVCCKKTSCWLWYAVNCDDGDVVVCVFGTRKSEVLGEFWVLLCGLNLAVVGVFSDDNFVYREIMSSSVLQIGERNT